VREIRGALDLADARGWQIEGKEARALLDRELGLLWGLTRRGRAKEASDFPPSGTRARSSHVDRLVEHGVR
jgi:hypothetical protein